jgi:multisubunit Na+/H+ antiporter MnhE subunit
MSSNLPPKTLSQRVTGELTTAQILVGAIVAIVISSLWLNVLTNFFFNTLKLDKDSSYTALIIALSITIFFFIILSSVGSISRQVILGGVDNQNTTSELLGGNEEVTKIYTPRCA